MKKKLLLLTGIAAMLAACENADTVADKATQCVTFRVNGDFTMTTEAMTRAEMTADGKAMTDLFLLDYMDGVLVQQLHQTAGDENFGTPTVELDYGSHHVYLVCSRGKTPTLSTEQHCITWATTSDTFWRDYAVTVASGSQTTHNVALDRVATRLTINILDEVPDDAATIEIAPATWYYGLDYVTGLPTGIMANEPRTINIPAKYIGTVGELTASVYGISGTEEWTTDITITARDGEDDIIGEAAITEAPFMANRTTVFSGNLYASGGTFALTLNTTWNDEYTGSW